MKASEPWDLLLPQFIGIFPASGVYVKIKIEFQEAVSFFENYSKQKQKSSVLDRKVIGPV